MDHIEIRLPLPWAPLLINGDDSGLDDAEVDLIDGTLRHLGLEASRCIDCTDEAEFELAPSWARFLSAGGYGTYTFI